MLTQYKNCPKTFTNKAVNFDCFFYLYFGANKDAILSVSFCPFFAKFDSRYQHFGTFLRANKTKTIKYAFFSHLPLDLSGIYCNFTSTRALETKQLTSVLSLELS